MIARQVLSLEAVHGMLKQSTTALYFDGKETFKKSARARA